MQRFAATATTCSAFFKENVKELDTEAWSSSWARSLPLVTERVYRNEEMPLSEWAVKQP